MDQATAGFDFQWVKIPASMVEGVFACTQSVVEDGQSLAEVSDLLRRVGAILRLSVPLSSSHPTANLVILSALKPLSARLNNLASDIELQMFGILAYAGVALEFETGREIPVQYHDRSSDDNWGVAKPDFYHPAKRVAIFCDSEAHHASAEARARDNGVSSALSHKRITPLRFTSGQILREPIAVGRTVLAHLSSRPTPRRKNRQGRAA